VTEQAQTFEPFANEAAYIHVNQKLVDRVLRLLRGRHEIRLLDVAAGTGLMTTLAYERALEAGAKLKSLLLDFDRPSLVQAQLEVPPGAVTGFVCGSADSLPLKSGYDALIFANALHLLEDEAKAKALDEAHRVLAPGGLFAMNSTFYEGAYPEESKPFYSRWIRRSIAEINQRLPGRVKSEKVQAMEWLPAKGYEDLLTCAGFKIVEMRERRVLLSQAAVRAISSYKEFAKGALHAIDEDAETAATALQVTVKQTFQDLKMKALPRNWLEIIAVKA
jgi:ubiquinone/menaquinone biosynthesis C-methylase UbiE